MRTLGELQTDFQQYLLQQVSGITTAIVSTQKVRAHARLDIYRHAYYARLLEVFRLDYPTLHGLLGDEAFHALGRRYIATHPSHFRSIRWFYNNLAAFMEKSEVDSANAMLIEMARFEWILAETFDATDQQAVSLEVMATIPFDKWPEMYFSMHALVRRMDLHWNVIELWRQADSGEPLTPKRHETPIPYVIWRKEYEIQFCSLTPDAAYMIDAMLAGAHFGDICEGFSDWLQPEEIPMHAASLLKRFIVDGLVHQVMC